MEERFALLIDADNVSAKYIKPILDELSKYGNVTYKRIYGDWTRPNSAGWKEELLQNSITPIQQFSYTYGKNATDSAMIIDAMDILYSGNVDGFCLVSSDSDFTRLAQRLREAGMFVMGIGEQKTPKPFRAACDAFKILEIISSEDTPEDVVPVKVSTDEIEKNLLNTAISRLAPRERKIVELRYGLTNEDGEEMTQKEVADLMGISQSYISRLEKKIMKRLKKEIVRFE